MVLVVMGMIGKNALWSMKGIPSDSHEQERCRKMFSALTRLIKKLRGTSHPAYLSGYIDTSSGTGIGMTNSVTLNTTNWASTNVAVDSPIGNSPIEGDKRIEAKPVDVVKELNTENPIINLGDLKAQIKEVEKRIKILKKQKVTPHDENEALAYIKARTKYKKYEKLFNYQITTNKLVEDLTQKYKLQRVNFGSYYKTVPTEALDELENFVNACKKVGSVEPEIKLIVDDGGKEHKKDPIMLGKSPFGRWWYILGAWDKEIKYVDDIIYNGK
jgi:hypothetical protein